MPSARHFGIAGCGTYLPAGTRTATDYARLTNLPVAEIADRFGIVRRHVASGAETTSAMAATAAQDALDEAGWAHGAFDVLIAACGVGEQPIPCTAALVQRRLGLGDSGIACFDVNATCLSFLVALDRVLAGFALGEWSRALIVSADIASAALDFSDPEASVLFGDGAAAIALEAGGPHTRLAHSLRTFGDGSELCRLEAGGTRLRPEDDLDAFLAAARFRMEGPALFRATGRKLPAFVRDLSAAAGITPQQCDLVIPHQASRAALDHFIHALGLDPARVVDLYAETGNMIATSLPFALAHARREGRLVAGSHALMMGSSAGVSLGGAVFRW